MKSTRSLRGTSRGNARRVHDWVEEITRRLEALERGESTLTPEHEVSTRIRAALENVERC